MGQPINLDADLAQAFKARDLNKVAALRLLVAATHNEKIAKGHELSNEEVIAVLKKEAKKRDESIAMYQKADRKDLADKEMAELQVIKVYLPAQMSELEVREVIAKMKAEGMLGSDFGANMKAAMAKLKGQADGGLIASLIKEML